MRASGGPSSRLTSVNIVTPSSLISR